MSGASNVLRFPSDGDSTPLRSGTDLDPLVYVGEPDCPPHLLPEARREWKRILPELVKARVVARIDRAALALYCQCWARWVWAEKQLARAMAAAAKSEAEALAAGKPWTGGDGVTIPTPNGHMTYSPHWVVANKAMEQVNRYLSNFGMSPASRKQVQAALQGDLFGDEGDTPAKPRSDGQGAGFGAL